SYSSNKGHLNKSKDAFKKCQRYLYRLFRTNQMDFEFAFWQMLYLFLNPKKVYVFSCVLLSLTAHFQIDFIAIATFNIENRRKISLHVTTRLFWCFFQFGS